MNKVEGIVRKLMRHRWNKKAKCYIGAFDEEDIQKALSAIQSYYENLVPSVEEIVKIMENPPLSYWDSKIRGRKDLAKSIRSEMEKKILR